MYCSGIRGLRPCSFSQIAFVRYKHKVDYSKVPKLIDTDLEERFVRGSGPGGQSVNKTSNCVVLKHLPSAIVIKCHETRSLDQNRKIAREHLTTKLDNLINKEDSVENQVKLADTKKSIEFHKRRSKLRELKAEWKARENIE